MAFPQNSMMAEDTMNALGAPDVQAIEVDPEGTHETCGVQTTTWALEWFNDLVIITSIPSIDKQVEVNLYPNPVIDVATFSSEDIFSFEIYDAKGTLVFKRAGNKVDFTGMKPGFYFVIGFDKNGNLLYKGKVIKN